MFRATFYLGWARVLSTLFVCLLTLVVACSRNSAAAVKEPSHDVAKLAKRVNLLESPQSVSYKVIPMGDGDGIFGPTDYTLIAVLQYDEASIARLKARSTRVNPEVRAVWLPDRPEWFPPAVQAAIARCSDHWCIPGEEYSSAEFLKAGFVTGNVIVPEGQNVVILVLRT
jgi:hypothetical protein